MNESASSRATTRSTSSNTSAGHPNRKSSLKALPRSSRDVQTKSRAPSAASLSPKPASRQSRRLSEVAPHGVPSFIQTPSKNMGYSKSGVGEGESTVLTAVALGSTKTSDIPTHIGAPPSHPRELKNVRPKLDNARARRFSNDDAPISRRRSMDHNGDPVPRRSSHDGAYTTPPPPVITGPAIVPYHTPAIHHASYHDPSNFSYAQKTNEKPKRRARASKNGLIANLSTIESRPAITTNTDDDSATFASNTDWSMGTFGTMGTKGSKAIDGDGFGAVTKNETFRRVQMPKTIDMKSGK